MFKARPLAPGDRPEWDVLWNDYQDFYKTRISPEVSGVTFTRLLDPNIPMHAIIGEVDGRIAGLAHCILHYSTWTAEPYCYLQDLITKPEFRRQGVATGLIQAVCDKAALEKASRVYWLTHESNTQAIRLYEKVADRPGFIQFRKLLT